MSTDFLPDRDKLIVQWATACASYASPRPIQTGRATTVVTELTTRRNDFQNSILLVESTHAAHRAAVKAKNINKKRVEETSRLINQQVQGNPAVNDETKLGLSVRPAKPSPVIPLVPEKFQAYGDSNGVNFLSWKAAGNRSGTQYEIWYKEGTKEDWRLLTTATTLRYEHKGVTPGTQYLYKVRAKRADRFSNFSAISVVYPAVSVNPLVMDKAA